MSIRSLRFSVPALAIMLAAGAAHAGPGDLLEVTADLVNLRAAPSDGADIRDRLKGGSQVIELRRDGGWYGVRSVDGGQEGWVYGRLLKNVSRSSLSESDVGAGFGELSPDFDLLVAQINERLGVDLIEGVTEADGRLTIRPTPNWLRRSSQEAQVFAATAIYLMWKNHREGEPATLEMLDADGEKYVVIEDQGEAGPRLTVIDEASGSEG